MFNQVCMFHWKFSLLYAYFGQTSIRDTRVREMIVTEKRRFLNKVLRPRSLRLRGLAGIRKNIFTWIQYTFMSICPTNGTITSISNPFFPTTPSNIPTPITLTLHFIAIIPTVFTSVGQTCKCISGSLLRKLTKNMKKKHILFQFAEISSEKCVRFSFMQETKSVNTIRKLIPQSMFVELSSD